MKKINERKYWDGLVSVAALSCLFGGFSHPAAAVTYGIKFVAARGVGIMNDAGTIAGTNVTLGDCFPTYPSCYSKNTTVVWPASGASPIPLPATAALPFLTISGINSAGWIAGTASVFSGDFKPQAVVWKPGATGYTEQELGLLPGNTIAKVAGIDNQNRIVGYNTITDINPSNAAPFLWDPIGGLSDLTDQGFPNEIPLDISPNGTVALLNQWFQLDVPGVVNQNTVTPKGFVGAEATAAINDTGDQARFLITGGSSNVAYFFRYHAATRQWQQLSPAGSGRLSPYDIGSINNKGAITGTVLGGGVIAAGPNGLAQSLTTKLSPAYSGVGVTYAGSLNAKGHIIARANFGRSNGRLVKLIPIKPCTAACIRVATLQMTAKSVSKCSVKNNVSTVLTATDEAGNPLSGVVIKGRFLDEYWLDKQVSATTDSTGTARFSHIGPGCVGAISFFVDNAQKTGRVFDQTQGKLTNFVIPAP